MCTAGSLGDHVWGLLALVALGLSWTPRSPAPTDSRPVGGQGVWLRRPGYLQNLLEGWAPQLFCLPHNPPYRKRQAHSGTMSQSGGQPTRLVLEACVPLPGGLMAGIGLRWGFPWLWVFSLPWLAS